jgi:hypothetical protein
MIGMTVETELAALTGSIVFPAVVTYAGSWTPSR